MNAPVDTLTPPPIALKLHTEPPIRWDYLATLFVILIAGFWSGRIAILENHQEDLWIYSSGSYFGFNGLTPYNTQRMHARVAERWGGDPNLDGNNGFFLSPLAMLVFAPFAFVPWTLAKVFWCASMIAIGIAAAWHLRSFSTRPLPHGFTAIAVLAIFLNPLGMFVLVVGQTPFMILGFVVLGQVAYARGYTRIGCCLWGLAFFKPHIALPLLPLAWALSGWRRAMEVAIWAGVLNVLAGILTLGDPLFLREYLAYLPQGHKAVEFNRVELNQQITSWNRQIIAHGGPIFELGAVGTLAGYAAVLLLTAARGYASSRVVRPSWLFAMAASSATVCCQLLPYELVLLALALPYFAELYLSGNRRDRTVFFGILAAIAFAFMSGGKDSPADIFAHVVGGVFDRGFASLGWTTNCVHVLLSHRSIGALSVFTLILANGPSQESVTTSGGHQSAERKFAEKEHEEALTLGHA